MDMQRDSTGPPAQRALNEILALMSWDERLAAAYRRAREDYAGAGSPAIPLGVRNYRMQYQIT